MRDTVHDYLSALAKGDGGKACDQMTERGRAELSAVLGAYVITKVGGSCETIVERFAAQAAPEVKRGLEDGEATDVRVDGSRATTGTRGGPGRLVLRRRGDKWLVDSSFDGGWRAIGMPRGLAGG